MHGLNHWIFSSWYGFRIMTRLDSLRALVIILNEWINQSRYSLLDYLDWFSLLLGVDVFDSFNPQSIDLNFVVVKGSFSTALKSNNWLEWLDSNRLEPNPTAMPNSRSQNPIRHQNLSLQIQCHGQGSSLNTPQIHSCTSPILFMRSSFVRSFVIASACRKASAVFGTLSRVNVYERETERKRDAYCNVT